MMVLRLFSRTKLRTIIDRNVQYRTTQLRKYYRRERMCFICFLKPGGKFMLALEMVEPNTGKFWSTRCQGMKIYTEQELTSFLEKGGFENIRSHRTHRSWCAMEGIKRA